MAVSGRKAVFLDKDGTIVEDVPYNVDAAHVRLASGAREALPVLSAAGYPIFIISNQSGVARGFVSLEELAELERHLRSLFESIGARLDGFYFCPHHPAGTVSEFSTDCECRKPGGALITRAVDDHGIDPTRSWMVGDILDDAEAGNRAGCQTVLLLNGNETVWKWSPDREPDYCALDLNGAADIIVHGGGFDAR